jgi:NDP-sugar pyrophosphorylase family protein
MAAKHLAVSAAILAGGLGTRLRSVVAHQPKVLAPVHGRPYLTFLLEQLAAASVEEVILLTGFQGEQVRNTLGEKYNGVRVRYSEEPSPLGTAGAVRWALPKLSAPTVLLLNGDSYCDVNLAAFQEFHHNRAADLSLVVARAPGTSRFGKVCIDGQGRVNRFEEKTAVHGTDWVNAGIYLLERTLIEEMPLGRLLSLERDLFPAWVKRFRLCGFRCAGRFLDIGTPQSYAEAEQFFPRPEAA